MTSLNWEEFETLYETIERQALELEAGEEREQYKRIALYAAFQDHIPQVTQTANGEDAEQFIVRFGKPALKPGQVDWSSIASINAAGKKR